MKLYLISVDSLVEKIMDAGRKATEERLSNLPMEERHNARLKFVPFIQEICQKAIDSFQDENDVPDEERTKVRVNLLV